MEKQRPPAMKHFDNMVENLREIRSSDDFAKAKSASKQSIREALKIITSPLHARKEAAKALEKLNDEDPELAKLATGIFGKAYTIYESEKQRIRESRSGRVA